MGQYFKAINKTKREYCCPWCMGETAKLWEWAANPHGAIFTLLLRKSDATGGGDVFRRTVILNRPNQSAIDIAEAIAAGVQAEGASFAVAEDSMVGRWAGDSVMLVGDYDSSRVWDELPRYRNISKEVVETWNAFIERQDMQLEYDPDCSCNTERKEALTPTPA